MRQKLFTFGLLISLLLGCLPAAAQQKPRELTQDDDNGNKRLKRTALVIGNAEYKIARKLANPANDAADMAKNLTDLGFEVISGTNLSLKAMRDKVREFGDRLRANGGVGLFYYAGHGIQMSGKNYLIPVEADIQREDEIEDTSLNFDVVLRKIATANNGLNIVILDACRNNPFARSWSRSADEGGLAQITAPTGTFIAYATSPDHTASDGTGRNGLYTSELLKIIQKPNIKLEDAFKQVTIAVDKASGGKQVPWTSSSLRGEFYFKQTGQNAAIKSTPTDNDPVIVAKDQAAQERETWDLVKNSTDPEDFRYFLKEFPAGANTEKAKIRLDELVWTAARTSNNKSKVQSYLNEFPSGTNVIAARLLLKQLEAKETAQTTNGAANTALTESATRKNSIGLELVYIPPGEFMMGSTEEDIAESLYIAKKDSNDARRDWFSNETPPHRVTIKEGFWMGKFEVTQAEWQAVVGDNPSNFKNCGPNCPVENISWEDIQVFLKKLNQKKDGFEYRLPTEAEWEYAARAGNTEDLYSGTGNLDEMGWYRKNSTNITHPVGQKQANAFGLFDMHGNVWEWVQDIYESSYSSVPADGSANLSIGDSNQRMLRGGSWFDFPVYCRSADRYSVAPEKRNYSFGFRVVARVK